jgi:hypothetical protein
MSSLRSELSASTMSAARSAVSTNKSGSYARLGASTHNLAHNVPVAIPGRVVMPAQLRQSSSLRSLVRPDPPSHRYLHSQYVRSFPAATPALCAPVIFAQCACRASLVVRWLFCADVFHVHTGWQPHAPLGVGRQSARRRLCTYRFGLCPSGAWPPAAALPPQPDHGQRIPAAAALGIKRLVWDGIEADALPRARHHQLDRLDRLSPQWREPLAPRRETSGEARV